MAEDAGEVIEAKHGGFPENQTLLIECVAGHKQKWPTSTTNCSVFCRLAGFARDPDQQPWLHRKTDDRRPFDLHAKPVADVRVSQFHAGEPAHCHDHAIHLNVHA